MLRLRILGFELGCGGRRVAATLCCFGPPRGCPVNPPLAAAVGWSCESVAALRQNQGRHAARCPSHPEFVLGLCYRCGATEEDAGGSAFGATVANIDEALVLPALAAATSIARASDMATLKRARKLILVLDLDLTLLNSTRLQDLSTLEQRNGFTPDTEDELHMELFRLEYSDNVRMLVKLRPFVRGFLEQVSSKFEMHVYTLGKTGLREGGHRPSGPGGHLLRRQGRVQKGVDPVGHEEPRRHPGRRPRRGGDPR
jgi:hypothetical protein